MKPRPYVIGFAGGTCSGKSTATERLAAKLQKDCRVLVIHMDSYFMRPTPTTIAPITRREYVEHNHPTSMHLDKMQEDFEAAITGADWDVVMIEGLFALHLDFIREKLDLKVFVDLKSDERIVRRIHRFMANGQTMEEVTDRYLDTVRFRHDELVEPTRWHADIVLNGTLDSHKGLSLLEEHIRRQLEDRSE